MLMSAFASAEEIPARIPVRSKPSGPNTFRQDQPGSTFELSSGIPEEIRGQSPFLTVLA